MAAISALNAIPRMAISTVVKVLNPLVALAEGPAKITIASAEVLAEALKGVGLAKAGRIIEYREAHGSFEYVDELSSVQSIGQATV